MPPQIRFGGPGTSITTSGILDEVRSHRTTGVTLEHKTSQDLGEICLSTGNGPRSLAGFSGPLPCPRIFSRIGPPRRGRIFSAQSSYDFRPNPTAQHLAGDLRPDCPRIFGRIRPARPGLRFAAPLSWDFQPNPTPKTWPEISGLILLGFSAESDSQDLAAAHLS